VGEDGAVASVEVLKGHPLLADPAADSVKKIRFQSEAAAKRTFDLTCEFSIREGDWAYRSTDGGSVLGPLHILIGSPPSPPIYTAYTATLRIGDY